MLAQTVDNFLEARRYPDVGSEAHESLPGTKIFDSGFSPGGEVNLTVQESGVCSRLVRRRDAPGTLLDASGMRFRRFV